MKKNNKLFTKISTIVVSLAMALGVGVAAASNGGFRRADAAVSTYRHIFNAKPSTGNNVTLSGVSWTVDETNLGSYNGSNYAGVQIGTSKANGQLTLTSSTDFSYSDKTVVNEIRLWLNLGGTSVTPSVSVGGTAATSDGTTVTKNSSAGSDYTQATRVKFTPATGHDTGVVVISVATVKAGYICAMEIDVDSAVAGYRVSYDKNTTDTVAGMPNNHEGLANSAVQSLTVNPAPERWGYTFGGWAATNDSNTPIESVTINGADATVYAIWNEDHTVAGKYSDNPYTVAQARAAIDSGTTEEKTGVYVRGIVSEIVTAFDAEHGNISYNISVDGETTSDQLQAYRGKSYNGDNFESADNIQVGDEVVVKGNLTKYNDTYEFAANNQLVSGAASYTVTNNIANTSCPISSIRQNQALNVTLSANEHFTLPSELTVTMGGNTLSSGAHYSYNSETGAFSINSVTGNVVISGAAVEDPKYTVTYLPGEGSGENYVSEPQYAGSYTLATFVSTGLTKPDDKTFKSWLVGEVEKQPNETIEITANITVTALYKDVETFKLFTGDLVEGDYLIVYGGKAMNTTVSSNRLQYLEPTIENDAIVDPDPSIIWHISPSETNGYWTLANAEASAYAAATDAGGSKNEAQMLNSGTDNKSLWSITMNEGKYEFINKSREGLDNKYLRNNTTYGFACYKSATGEALTLYKLPNPKLDSVTSAGHKVTFTLGETFTYGGTLTAHYTDWKDDAVVAPTSLRWDAEDGTEIDLNAALSIENDNNRDVYVVYTEGGVTKSISYKITVQYADITSLRLYRHDNSQEVEVGFDLPVGQKLQLDAVLNDNTNPNTHISWRTSDNSKATVDEGLVEAIAAGNANITAFVDANSNLELDVGEVYKTVSVHIDENPAFSLNKKTIDKYTGTNETVELVGTASNFNGCDSIEFEWTTSNASVANVSKDQNYANKGNVTFGVAGEATITCTAKGMKNGQAEPLITLSDTCEVTVHQSKVNSVTIDAPTTDGKLYLGTAETEIQLSAAVDKVGSASPNVNWSSSNENVAKVIGGLVVAQNAGTATITASSADDQNIKDTFEVTVYTPDSIKVTAPTKVDYELGEEFDNAGFSVKAVFGTGDNKVEKDAVGYNEPNPDMTKLGKQTIEISLRGKTDSFDITISKHEYYTKLTDASTLAAGDEILIVAQKSNDYYAAVGELVSDTSKRLKKTEVTITEKGIVKTEELVTAAFRLYEQDGKFALMASNGKFLSSTKEKEVNLVDDPVFVNFATEDGHIVISYGETIGRLLYNSASNAQWFTTYTSAQTLTDIYVKKGNGTNPALPKHLTGIEVTTQPTKTTYEIGDELDTTGLVVTAKYSDGTSEAVTDYTLSKFHSNDAGEKTIVVTYQSFTATFKVTVNEATQPEKTLESISVEGPTTTTYTVGQDLDTTGLVVTAHYSDQSTEAVTDYTISGYDKTTAGTQTITVTYGEKTTTFTVTVSESTQPSEKTLESVDVSGSYKTEYKVGEQFDATNLVVSAVYSDGSKEVVPAGEYQLSGFSSTEAGTVTITVTYGGKSTTFTVTVSESTQPQPEDLSAAKEAAINELHDFFLAINQNEYDLAGQTALGRAYDDGIAAINASTTTTEVATALANAKAAINAVEKAPAEVTLSSIAVSGDYKTEYTVGDTFNPAGLVVTATYSDGTTANVALSDVTISGFSTETAGTVTVTVLYNGKTATFTVTVSEAPVADPLAEAKANAISELDSFIAGLNEADYSEEAWAQIQSAVAQAKEAINSATDADALNALVANVKNLVNNLDLAKAKAAALAALEEYYNGFNADNYDETGLAALATAYNNGKDAINAATSTEGVAAALVNAKTALDAVETKPAEQPAKKRCGGDIAATSIILSTLALAGAGLLVFKKRKED